MGGRGGDLEVSPESGEEGLSEKIGVILDSMEDEYRLEKRDFLRRVFDAAFSLIPEAEKGTLYELVGDLYRPVYSKGYDMGALSRIAFNRTEAFVDFGVELGAPIRSYETTIRKRDAARFSSETMEAFRLLGTVSGFTSLYAPIVVAGEVLGLISLEKFGEGSFTALSRKVLRFYARIISQFYAHKLAEERDLRRLRETVDALVSAIEVMDKYTEGHARRVARLSVQLARRLGFSEEGTAEIADAAALHDVGKIGIPSPILCKAGPLTPAEFEIIKLHCGHSRKIISRIEDFGEVAEIAYHHHERFDGSGYPEGLAGSEVPLGSYIVGLADAYDAMTSSRSYREALPVAEARVLVMAGEGSQFHPEVARAFAALYEAGEIGPASSTASVLGFTEARPG